MGEPALEYSWAPFPGPQTDFLARGEFEALFGGSAGPGKTDCLIMAALRFAHHPGYRGVLFRRTFPQLQEIIDRCHEYVSIVDPGAEWRAGQHRWYFSAGGTLNLSHLQHEDSKYDHQGRQYSFIGFDELTQFTLTQYLYLFSRCRSLSPGLPKLIRSTTNPGGIGHDWVRRRFRIGIVEPKTTIFEDVVNRDTGEVTRLSRVFVPATMDDNPALLANDPMYLARLELLPEAEKMRLRYGIWDAFEGQAFPELCEDVHGFDFDVPPEWEVFGCFDWGYSKPFSYGLYAVDYDGRIYRFAERYGAKEEDGQYTDEGLRMSDAEIARAIHDLEGQYQVRPRVRIADPAIWSRKPQKGGVSGQSCADTFRDEGLHFARADNDRIPGRQQVHHRLQTDEDGKPWVYVHKRCRSFWQTMPLMREATANPEDIESKDVPDHVYDEFRYACKYRPIRPKVAAKEDHGSFQAERRRLIQARRMAARYGISETQAYARMR